LSALAVALDASPARRDRRDRRRSAASQVDGWLPAADLQLPADALSEIDAAIAASGAGTDEPPSPPPHMRPVAVEQ
jgi:hypothetical protein